MESANEKKEHWIMIDLTKFVNSFDPVTFDNNNDNLLLLKELLNQYNEQVEQENKYGLRFERNLKTQRKIILTFFIFFILFQLNMMYNSANPVSLDKLIFLFIFMALLAFVCSQRIGP